MAPPPTRIIASVINMSQYLLCSGAEVPSRMSVLSQADAIAPNNPNPVSAFELEAETAPSLRPEYLAYFVGSRGSAIHVWFSFRFNVAGDLGGALPLDIGCETDAGFRCSAEHVPGGDEYNRYVQFVLE
jgi:hypothetical protein